MSTNNAKFTFWYLLSLVALIFMALGTGQVAFQVINKLIPDFAGNYAGVFSSDVLKFAISSLIICTPLYFIITRQIEHSLIKGELDKDSAIRRWLTYAILFISSVVMVVWLIVTINSFLDGDLTSKFLLKGATVIIIAGLVFSYYFFDSRRDKIRKNDPMVLSFLIAGLVLSIAALVTAFFFVESPAQTRAKRHDQAVLNHFSQIDSAVNAFYTQKGKLPANVGEISNDAAYLSSSTFKDPESGKAYDYKIVDKASYELCADFRLSNKEGQDVQFDMGYGDWPHDAGYQCLKHQISAPLDMKASDSRAIPATVK